MICVAASGAPSDGGAFSGHLADFFVVKNYGLQSGYPYLFARGASVNKCY